MTQDNVVYIQQTGLARLERAGHKLDAVVRQSTQVAAAPTRGFSPYEPAIPRCKTCCRFKDGEYCSDATGVYTRVPKDGSGYCHRHEAVW
jgi:hypothetical protein